MMECVGVVVRLVEPDVRFIERESVGRPAERARVSEYLVGLPV